MKRLLFFRASVFNSIYRTGFIIAFIAVVGMSVVYRHATNFFSDLLVFAVDRPPALYRVSLIQQPPLQGIPKVTKDKDVFMKKTMGPVRFGFGHDRFFIGYEEHQYSVLKSGGYGFLVAPLLNVLRRHLSRNTLKFQAFIIGAVIEFLLLLGIFLFFASIWSTVAGILAVFISALEPTIDLGLICSGHSELLYWTAVVWTMFFLVSYRSSGRDWYLIAAFATMGFGMANKFTFAMMAPVILFSGFFPVRVSKSLSVYAIAAFLLFFMPQLLFLILFPETYVHTMISGITIKDVSPQFGSLFAWFAAVFVPPLDFSDMPAWVAWARMVAVVGPAVFGLYRGTRSQKRLILASWAVVIIVLAVIFIMQKGRPRSRGYDLWLPMAIAMTTGLVVVWERLRAFSNMAYVFVLMVVMLLVPSMIVDSRLIPAYKKQMQPVATVPVQEKLFRALDKVGERHPLLLRYQGDWSLFSMGVLTYASKGHIRPDYLYVDRSPKPWVTAMILRQIRPEGPIRMVWLASGGRDSGNSTVRNFANNLLARVPYRVLKVLDREGDLLIEFFPDKLAFGSNAHE